MYSKAVLSNGIRIVYKKMESLKSVSIGYWFRVGSINEIVDNSGVSHFIEHMLFKETKNRTAKDISGEIDELGGEINAFTSKECTCFYARVLGEHVENAVDILSDMTVNSLFSQEEIDKERNVILDEINLYEDTPEELAYDMLSEMVFDNHPLAMPILGTKESLEKINREEILDFYHTMYTPENLVISVAGNVDESEIVEILEKSIGGWDLKGVRINDVGSIYFKPGNVSRKKDIEQAYLNICFRGVNYESDELYPLLLLNNIVGGSNSSRLFQKLREEFALLYSVDSDPSFYHDSGIFVIYTSMVEGNINQVCDLIIDEINDIIAGNVTDEEVSKFKKQLKGSYLLGLEGSGDMMHLLGKGVLMSSRIKSVEEITRKIEAITKEDVINTAKYIFDKDQIAFSLVSSDPSKYLNKIVKKFKNNMN